MTDEMTMEEVERLEAEVRRLKRALADVTASISAVARAKAVTLLTAQQSALAAKEAEIAELREALEKVVVWLETEFEGQDDDEMAGRNSGLAEARVALERGKEK